MNQTNHGGSGGDHHKAANRKRSNSQSQTVSLPKVSSTYTNRRRNQVQYYVSLLPLNDTFTKKHLPIAIYPETTKLGRPTGTRHKPDVNNGYFDSRVLSRNHAQMYIDGASGKLMLQDLNSSNGTYLNDQRLGTGAIEVKIGDVVCLGFNVQTESTHKQISLKIEDIDIIKNSQLTSDSTEFRHMAYIENLYKVISKANDGSTAPKNRGDDTDTNLSFDDALFGDINANLEDDLLASFSQTNAGIYNNSQITNTSTFESIINILITNLHKIKQQNNNLHSLENFLIDYQNNLNEINAKRIEAEVAKNLQTIQAELDREKSARIQKSQKLTAIEKSHLQTIDDLNYKIEDLQQENLLWKEKFSKLLELQAQNHSSKEIDAIPLTDRSIHMDTIVRETLLNFPINNSNSKKDDVKKHQSHYKCTESNGDISVLKDVEKDLTSQTFIGNDDDINDVTKLNNEHQNEKSFDVDVNRNSPTKLDPKKAADIDLNELFLGLSTNDDITHVEDSTSSKVSELQLLDTEEIDETDPSETKTKTKTDQEKPSTRPLSPKVSKLNNPEVLLHETLHENKKLLAEGIHPEEEKVEQQEFPTKSDDRFNSNEEVLQRVIVVVGAMFIGYLVKKISG
jgi:hypothetical protein